jgi:muramoyltetrapeptide carboxypeptidase
VSVVRPRALRAGDVVGICAPSGPVDAERLAQGMAELEALGFHVRVGESTRARDGFTAGSAALRLADLHALFADPEVAGIVCARGGAGAAPLLGRLDESLLLQNPKVFIGYSDVTLLHLVLGRLGIVSLHGPMAAIDLYGDRYDRDSFRSAVMGEGPLPVWRGLRTLRPGDCTGRLRGGCLSLVASVCGTRFGLPSVAGEDVILFLEDVNEAPYRCARMLWQLRESGALRDVKGIVFGTMDGCIPAAGADYSLEDVLRSELAGLEIPMAFGLAAGHTALPNLTLPLGVRMQLTCGDTGELAVLEPAVS